MSTALAVSLRAQPAPVDHLVDVFLRYLKAEGVRFVFGIPAGLLYPFFDSIERDPDLELVMTRHEEGAAFMADGFARTTRRLAVCAGTSGPGATNLLTGIACAKADGVPLLVVTGQAARHAIGKGAAQETGREDIDIVEMFRPVTKYSAMVTSADSLPRHLRRALRLAQTDRPGPVHLNIPVDLWEQPLREEWFTPSSYRPSPRTFDRDAVAAAGDALLRAERPVILAGAGVHGAGAREQLRALAELLPARVATTPRAKGVLPEDHPLSLGVLGLAGHDDACEAVLGGDADLLLSIGASLNETTTFNWHPELIGKKTFVQCDIDPDRIGRNYPVDVALVGDAQTILVELAYHLHRRIRGGVTPASSWAAAPAPKRGIRRVKDPELGMTDRRPLTPQRWRAELQDVLPDDALIFSDIGGHMLFNLHYLTIRAEQQFHLNLGFGSMGHGTVAPIGAALAHPGRPVLAIVGDACFEMNGMELLTAVEYDVPVIWLVENNNMHGISYHTTKVISSHGQPLRSVVYRNPVEIAAITRAMGMTAHVVDQPGRLGELVKDALAKRAPTLIEIRVDPDVAPPLGARARSLAGFIRE